MRLLPQLSPTQWSSVASLAAPWVGFFRSGRLLAALLGVIGFAFEATAAETPGGDFGKDVQLAPFVVNGKPLSISIHARTKADRQYAEKFAEEAVEVAYETLGRSTGKGLVIVGAEGEPHPVLMFRKFLTMARAGQIDPGVLGFADDVEQRLKAIEGKMKIQDDPANPSGITFDLILPALPLPLEGAASRLYQLAWNEGFDEARIEQKMKSLTRADLERNEFTRYDWVFYVPPEKVMTAVFKDMLKRAMKAQKMGLFKRAAVRSAIFVFNPVVKKAFDSARKGVLYMTILRTEPSFKEGDVDALTQVYIQAIMPDLKPGSGDEGRRVREAITKQKIVNAEYAKDPFVKPARLATFDPADYEACLGEYRLKPLEVMCVFKREGDSFEWNYKKDKPRPFYPAGERLLVNEDGSMTIHFLVDEAGAVTGVEERWVRRRQAIPRASLATK